MSQTWSLYFTKAAHVSVCGFLRLRNRKDEWTSVLRCLRQCNVCVQEQSFLTIRKHCLPVRVLMSVKQHIFIIYSCIFRWSILHLIYCTVLAFKQLIEQCLMSESLPGVKIMTRPLTTFRFFPLVSWWNLIASANLLSENGMNTKCERFVAVKINWKILSTLTRKY